jgi:hypothetical protein
MEHIYNVFGECIDGLEKELASKDFGKEVDGVFGPDWTEPSDLVDNAGFDKTHTEPNGYYIQDVELPKGTRLCRYGGANGRSTTLLGTPYEKLGLPFRKETMEYHEYVVSADGISVRCIVTRGRVAPMFDSPGGAIQFLHKREIAAELDEGCLEEVMEWLTKKK